MIASYMSNMLIEVTVIILVEDLSSELRLIVT